MRGFAIFHADMHVQPEDQVGARHHLHVFDDLLVALRRDRSPACASRRRDGCRPRARRRPFRLASPIMSRRSCVISSRACLDVLANAGADLDHRLVHLGLYRLLQQRLALLDDLDVDVRAQIAGFRIDGLILFFDADGETWAHDKSNRRRGNLPLVREKPTT